MAQDIKIAGATYSDVPAVDITKPNGGSARYVDESVVNSDVAAAYGAVQAKGGTVPQSANSGNLAAAIGSIPSGGRTIPEKITDYLFYLDIDFDLDYDAAAAYAEAHSILNESACSSVRKGGLLGRNLDWSYDETAEFVVNVHATKGRHASVGIATGLSALTNAFAESGAWSDLYALLPFGTTDGVNDRGVCIEMNTVRGHQDWYAQIDDDNDVKLTLGMVPRYVLDNADSAAHAITLLGQVDILPPIAELPADVHFMIADEKQTFAVEFIPDGSGGTEMAVMELPDADDHLPIMTNFYLWDYFDDSETIIGAGEERYQTLAQGYEGIESEQDVFALLAEVYATVANRTTLGSRDGTQSHTVHAAVYDLEHRALAIRPQPDVPNPTGELYRFAVGNAIFDRRDCVRWDDVQDKPFFERTIPAIDIGTPDYTTADAVAFTCDIDNEGLSLPAKLVRVGDYVNKDDILGASFSNTLGANGATIDSFLDDGVDDYMAIGDGIPIIMVASQPGATFAEDGYFSVTVPAAGIWFPWVDASTLGAGQVYTTGLQIPGKHELKKLDSKFIPGNIFVDAACTAAQLVSGVTINLPTGTAAQTMDDSRNLERSVLFRLLVADIGRVFFLPLQASELSASGPTAFNGAVTTVAALDGTEKRWLISARSTLSDVVTITATPINEGGKFVVSATVTESNGSLTATVDKTFAQISAAKTAGLVIEMHANSGLLIVLHPVVIAETGILFTRTMDHFGQVNAGIDVFTISIDNNDTVTVLKSSYSGLTAATGVSF